MSPTLIWPYLSIWTSTLLTKNHLTNLSTVPHPITRTCKFSIPILHWILAFFHIEGGLIIKFKVTISAHQTEYFFNTFCIEISFGWYLNILYPHQIEESRIVLGYFWPSPYYQVNKEEIICAPSIVSITTGVTASEGSMYANTPSLPSTPEILPQAELPVLPNYFTLGLQVQSELASLLWPINFNRPPFAADLTVDQVLAQIRSGVDLDQLAFREGNITYQNLWNIDQSANPHLYPKSSIVADNNYEQPFHEASENEAKGEESTPLPIPDPTSTHLTTQESEQFSTKQSSENTNYELERHLGTIMEETFQERMTL